MGLYKFRSRNTVAIAIVATALGTSTAASTGVDTSPQPDGVYPLTPGIYVAQGAHCAAPPDAAVRHYDGKGIRTTSTRDCRAAVREQEGKRYKVDQTCLDASVGLGQRFVQRQTIEVPDALGFILTIGKTSTTYRHCPAGQLPAALRKTFE